LTNDPSQMRVMWVSDSAETPTVLYGTSPDTLSHKATGTSHTYQASDMCNAPANQTGARLFRDVGWIHDVLLTGLPNQATIYYRFGYPKVSRLNFGHKRIVSGMSEVNSFVTPPSLGSPQPVHFTVYGDMGVGPYYPEAPPTANHVATLLNDTAFVLHIGDLSYALSQGWAWEAWFDLLYPIATRVPYMVGIGNHEYDHAGTNSSKDPSGASGNGYHPAWVNYGDDSVGECGVPPFQRFHMPDNGNSLFWYSFDYANVHIVHMSTEHDFTPGSVQYTWLEQDLATVDRNVFPWVILAGHPPCIRARITQTTIASRSICKAHLRTCCTSTK